MAVVRLWTEYEDALKQLFAESGIVVAFVRGTDCSSYCGGYCFLALYVLENNELRLGTLNDVLKVTPGNRHTAKTRLAVLARQRTKLLSQDPFACVSERAANVLRSNGISTLDELASLSINKVMRYPNCGKKTVEELTLVLTKAGMSFAPYKPGWTDP